MKTRILSVLLFVLLAFPSFGASRRSMLIVKAGEGGLAGRNPDTNSGGTNETYEGTGTSVAGWRYGDNTAGAITNANYTTSPAPIYGAQSLCLRGTSGNGAYTLLNTPAGTTQMHLRWMMIVTNTIVNNSRLIWCADGTATEQLQIQIQSSGLRAKCGTASATTTSTLTPGVLYYCWADYVKGSGANATYKVAFSQDGIRPTSGNNVASGSNGSSTGDARETGPWCQDLNFTVHVGAIFDNFSMNLTQEIGDFPSDYLVLQDFEGTGYDHGEVWTEDAGPPTEDADYLTAPILGGQSLALNKSGAQTPGVEHYWNSLDSITNRTNFWVVFAVRPTNTNVISNIFSSWSNATEYGVIYIRDTARITLYDSTQTPLASPTAGIPSNSVSYIKAHWNYTDGTGDIEHSTTTTFLGSGTKYAAGTGGAANGMMGNRIVFHTTGALTTNYFDFVRVYANDPGAIPR